MIVPGPVTPALAAVRLSVRLPHRHCGPLLRQSVSPIRVHLRFRSVVEWRRRIPRRCSEPDRDRSTEGWVVVGGLLYINDWLTSRPSSRCAVLCWWHAGHCIQSAAATAVSLRHRPPASSQPRSLKPMTHSLIFYWLRYDTIEEFNVIDWLSMV